ncbi:MAG: hypothetical protein VX530_04280 [Candidatus Neomarinimicrobiota bacterium]|nr:hypothetical protein [Candidatus Neomarinimicrobiota bacterium]
MMKQKIFIWFVAALVMITNLSSQSLFKQQPKTLFWGLIKIDKEDEYEEGYWFDKWFRSREFSAPVTYMPVEIRYGLGLNGKFSGSTSSPSVDDMDNWIWYNSEVSPLSQEAKNIVGTSIDIDFGMVNIPNIIMNTSWMNFLTGINYRSSSILVPKNIPDDWKEGTSISENKIQFKPELREYLITNTIQWQPFNPWYINFRYGYGLAFSKFYFDKDIETINSVPSGSGTSMALGLGLRYIIDPGKSNRFSIGIDIRHSYTKINNITDPDNITPVKRFDLANYGIYFTLSTFYGGKKTIGDDAKKIYYKKDYLTSKNKFIEFLKHYPNHSNRYRAMKYISECNKKIPYQIMEEGLLFDDMGESEKALDKYIKARSRVVIDDTLIVEALNFRIDEIARKWMNSAELLLDNALYKEALSLVKKVAKFSDLGDKELNKFRSFVILGEGKKLQSILILGKAMEKYSKALELNIDLKPQIIALQYLAGIQLIEIADQVDEFDEIILAIQSLEQAKGISSGIGTNNEKLLKDLKNKLKKLDNYKTGMIIDHKMSEARYLQAIARSPRLTIGMTLPLIEDLLGAPHEKIISEKNAKEEQLWIYYLNEKQLQLSFKDFILFKIEEL